MVITLFSIFYLFIHGENIKRWLQDTQQMKPGNDMIVKLKPEEIDDLMAYLTQLK